MKLVDVEVVESLVEAHARIERFHELQKPRDLWLQEMEPALCWASRRLPLTVWASTSPGAVRPTVIRAHVCGPCVGCRCKRGLRLLPAR